MTGGALVPVHGLEGLLAVVAGPAGLALCHGIHGERDASLLHLEQGGMAVAALGHGGGPAAAPLALKPWHWAQALSGLCWALSAWHVRQVSRGAGAQACGAWHVAQPAPEWVAALCKPVRSAWQVVQLARGRSRWAFWWHWLHVMLAMGVPRAPIL